jgi:hypothetical protein
MRSVLSQDAYDNFGANYDLSASFDLDEQWRCVEIQADQVEEA